MILGVFGGQNSCSRSFMSLYRPIIIVKKTVWKQIFSFSKIGIVLGMRDMFQKSIAKKWVRPLLTSE